MHSPDQKTTILMDASSAILLYKTDLFIPCTTHYRILLAPVVCQELTAAPRPGSKYFADVCHNQHWEVLDDGNGSGNSDRGRPALQIPSSLDRGERQTIERYLAGFGKFLMLDDGAAARFCKKMQIPFINGLLLPQILFLSGKLSNEERTAYFNRLCAVGRYSSKIIDFAGNCNREHMAFFLVDP